MTAAARSRVNDPKLFEIALVESDDIGIVGVGEATIPTIHWFNQLAGIDDRDLLRETQATYNLGIEFAGWNGDGTAYLHPFGRYGGPADGAMFFFCCLCVRVVGVLFLFVVFFLFFLL